MDHGNTEKISNNSFGAIVARAGTGKTAIIVQLAIDTIFQNNAVLHVSLNEPVDKVSAWYKEVLSNLESLYNLDNIVTLWESIESLRFIMTFKVEKFSVPTLKERLKDLTEQQIFKPKIVVIDGLPFDNSITESLENLKDFSKEQNLHFWFTIMTHRHEKPTHEGLPVQLSSFNQIFDDIVELKPKNKKIYIESLKGHIEKNKKTKYFLDPSTMLIRKI
jgi:hypothetical protein